MLVSEIFYSIQGEGRLAGLPSTFIRTSGCNLRCSWCDTPYASWKPEGEEFSISEIVSKALEYPGRHCVLTGGEPMVARDIHALAGALKERGYHITIETAGTLPPNGIACDLASISPKVSNSTPSPNTIDQAWIVRHERDRLNYEALRGWVDGYDYQLKFVVEHIHDLEEIEVVLRRIGRSIDPSRVLLMPEGTDSATLRERQAALAAICLDRGYRYCDRLHIHLYGNKRGT